MAEQTLVTFLDDFTGEEGAERVVFSHGGRDFTIDLKGGTRANFVKMLAAFEDKMAPFLAVASPLAAPAPVKRRKTGSAAEGEAATVRKWARENGITVGTRGRIAPEVTAAYLAATSLV